jgi:hypothetical protein
LSPFELLVKDNVFTGELESGRQEIVFLRLLFVVLLIKVPFELLEVLIEHVFAAEFVPASEMIDPHVREDTVLLEHPVYLLLFAPDNVPVVVPRLLPLAVDETVVHAVFKGGFEFDAAAKWGMDYGGVG